MSHAFMIIFGMFLMAAMLTADPFATKTWILIALAMCAGVAGAIAHERGN